MGKVALLFPGQGSQAVGMGADLFQRYPEAREVFAQADEALGEKLSELCFSGPEEALRLTRNTQPAILTVSLAVFAVLSKRGLRFDGVAGHSLGEYSAVGAAGGAGVADLVRVVRLRGELMQQAVPVGEGAMTAVLGASRELVEEACRQASQDGSVVVPANFNAPEQTVIAGHTQAVARAEAWLSQQGVRKLVRLPVSAPFHSPLMAPARDGLKPALEALRFADLSVPLYNNVDARPVQAAEEVRDGLVRQVDAPVRWVELVSRMVADGFDTFYEVGPGNVLSGLVRRIAPGVKTVPVGKVEQVESLF
ncbi:MAG: malonyl CoA-acyl carrier protein transacylase [Thermoanaerobaculum sp.]|nr:MAG: malonyl CoA-acyl carrier protein transacylase [Thermoanaerobaculum sp.]